MDPTTPSNVSPSPSSQGSPETAPPLTQTSTADRHQHSLSDLYRTQFQKDAEEQSHWEDVCRAYRQYANYSLKQWGLNHVHRLASLPASQAAVLPEYLKVNTEAFRERQNRFKEAAIRNQFCLDCILRHAGQPHSQEVHDTQFANDEQMSKVSSVLKSLTRDWSEEGKVEREMAYLPILESLQACVPVNSNAPPPRICVPGAGVGRLACEIASRGYTAQGNEFSLYMLLASDFILNGPTNLETKLSISPWLLETRNLHAPTDPLRTVQIPDVDPFEMVYSSNSSTTNTTEAVAADSTQSTDIDQSKNDFSMVAGDFVSVYSADTEKEQWDGVVACFFLDASPVIIEYLQVMHHMLKPGGYLIHFGPLLWHFSGPPMSLEDATIQDYHKRYSNMDPKFLVAVDFSWDDVQQILVNIGFEIVQCVKNIPALYTADRNSMLFSQYQCIHLVARKRQLEL